MATITGVTITELGEAVVAFSAPVDTTIMETGQNWTIAPVANTASRSSVYDAEPMPGGLNVKVWFSPWLSPQQDYTITAYESGANTSFTFAAPNVNKELGTEWNHGLLRAISRAFGQTIQEFSGQPETVLTKDIRPDDQHVFVESTLAFPDSGYFYVGNSQYKYTSKEPASFRTVSPKEKLNWTHHARQLVTASTAEILPYRSRIFLDASGDGNNGIL